MAGIIIPNRGSGRWLDPINSVSLPELEAMTDPKYLKHDTRTANLASPQLRSVLGSTVILATPSSEFHKNGKYWHQYILFTDFVTYRNKYHLSMADAVDKAIRESDVHIYCSCLAPNTPILTRQGYVPVSQVKVGDEVLTHKGRWRKVLAAWSCDSKKQFYEVVAPGHPFPLVCSAEHKLYVNQSDYRKGGKEAYAEPCFRTVGELFSKQDSNSWAHRVTLPKWDGGVAFDPDYARLLGYYLAEGCMQFRKPQPSDKKHCRPAGSQVKLTFNLNELNTVVADSANIARARGWKARVNQCEVVRKRTGKVNHWAVCYISSKDFQDDCLKYCGHHSQTKRLHSDVFEWSREARLNLFLGWFLGDGYYKFENNQCVVMTVSLQLAQQMQVLAASLGWRGSLSVARDLHLDMQDGNHSRVWQLVIDRESSGELYERALPFFRDRDKERGWTSAKQPKVANVCGVVPFRIQSITPVDYDGLHYDLMVEEDESFIAAGMVVHNCPAFLYWGDKYFATRDGYGYGSYKERRAPKRNNVNGKNRLCKHMSKALIWLEANRNRLVAAFTDYYESLKARKDGTLVARDGEGREEIMAVDVGGEPIRTTYVPDVDEDTDEDDVYASMDPEEDALPEDRDEDEGIGSSLLCGGRGYAGRLSSTVDWGDFGLYGFW